jgi:hypothetical protein
MQLRTHVLPFVVLLAGCPAKQPPDKSAETPSASTGPAATTPEAAPTETAEPASGAALTEDVVKRFMASMQDKKVDGIMEGIGKELGLEDKESPESIKKMLGKAATSAELTETVKAHGFKDAAEWVDTLKRVLPGMAAAMEKVMVDMMGPDAAAKVSEGGGDDEFAAMKEAFGEPSEADVAVIAKVVKEEMEAEHGGEGKSAP